MRKKRSVVLKRLIMACVLGMYFLLLPSFQISSTTTTTRTKTTRENEIGFTPTKVANRVELLSNTKNSFSDSTNVTIFPMLQRHPNFFVDFPLCLVHVGKAGGSSISCGLGLTYADCEGMPRDRLHYIHYFHMKRNNCPKQSKTYVVTLRNPIHRLQSWFDFEKDIIPQRGNKHEQEQIRKKRNMLFMDCYPTFEDLINIGLQSLPTNHMISAAKPINMTCPERAWAAVLGVRAFSYHEWYNYEHYWMGMQRGGYRNDTSNLYVLRTEHLQRDWATLSNETVFRPVNRGKNNTKIGNLLSTDAMEKLCDALCQEIQFYKLMLNDADNLNAIERKKSIDELQKYCPEETPSIRTACPDVPTFPTLRLSRRQYRSETKQRLFTVI